MPSNQEVIKAIEKLSGKVDLFQHFITKLSGKVDLLELKLDRLGEKLDNVVNQNFPMMQIDNGEGDSDVEQQQGQFNGILAEVDDSQYPDMDEDDPTSPALQTIMSSSHNTPHVCLQCGLSVANSFALRRHIKTRHSDDKPFQCDKCGTYFKRRDHMNVHNRKCPGPNLNNNNNNNTHLELPPPQEQY